jgi:hypothetical protein
MEQFEANLEICFLLVLSLAGSTCTTMAILFLLLSHLR